MSAGWRAELSDAAKAARRARLDRVRTRCAEIGVDALLLSHGADLPWLTGYTAMPLERLTMLVVPADPDARLVLVVPALEEPRVPEAGDLLERRPWVEGEDPVGIVRSLLSGPGGPGPDAEGAGLRLAVSDRAWATTLLSLEAALPAAQFVVASSVTGPVRAVKDGNEIEALRQAGAAADRVATTLQSGAIALRGRTERAVSGDLSALLVEEGHLRVNFAIVGSGPNGASPHHEAGERVIGVGDAVVCDFGGSLSVDGEVGYCSDITRTVVVGDLDGEVARCYGVLKEAQAAAVAAVRPGATAASIDAAARSVITEAGLGDAFVHRTGHGIGIEEHEDPYIVTGNETELVAGHAFSVEPGIYFAGRFGMRLEDIVVVTDDGVESLNRAPHDLVVLDA